MKKFVSGFIVPILLFLIGCNTQVGNKPNQMKIISYNVGIGTRNLKQDTLYGKLRMIEARQLIDSADILCLQEMGYPANKILCKDFKKVRGTGLEHPIYIKKDIKTKSRHFAFRGSAIELDDLLIITQHNHGNDSIFKRTGKQIDKYISKKNLPTIICGDGNKTINEAKSIVDTTKYCFYEQNELTYEHFGDKSNTKTVDYFVSTDINSYNIESYKVLPGGTDDCSKCSDHRPIMLIIKK